MMHQKCYQGLEEAFLLVTFFNPFHATIFSIPPENIRKAKTWKPGAWNRLKSKEDAAKFGF